MAKEVHARSRAPVRSVGPTDAPAQVVRAFKGRTVRVLRQEFAHLGAHSKVLWSPSYFAAAVGYVWESTVRRYIEHQWDAVASMRRGYVFRLRPTARQHVALAACVECTSRALQRGVAGTPGWVVAQQDPHPLRRSVGAARAGSGRCGRIRRCGRSRRSRPRCAG